VAARMAEARDVRADFARELLQQRRGATSPN